MSSENEVSVRIVGDASKVAPAVEETKSEMSGLAAAVTEISAQMASLGATIAAAMAPGAAATAEMAGEMRTLIAETEGESLSLRGMAVSAHEAAEAAVAMRESLMGFGELLLAAFAVEGIAHFTESMGESAEHVKHLADEFGLSIAEVERLQGVALGTGASIDTLARGMAILDKTTATASGAASAQGKALALVGISANDGRTQMERLAQVADKFSQLSAGPERLALAMELFGRNGKEMVPILEQGSKGIEELSAKAEALGMVNEGATEKGVKLAESVNQSRIAWAGLKTTLEDAFAPLLTSLADGFQSLIEEMVQSYEHGGAVKQIFDALTVTAQIVGQAIRTFGEAFVFLYEHMNVLIPIVGGLAAVLVGKYVVGVAAALINTTELRIAIMGLIGTFEAGGVVAAFTALITGLAEGMVALAAATAEATLALLASPWTWIALAVAGAIALYRELTAETKEQINAANDLNSADEKLAEAQGNLAGKSKEALEQMRAETQVALDLASAHLKQAQAALVAAQAEAQLAKDRAVNTPTEGVYAGGDMVGSNSAPLYADASISKAKAKDAEDAYTKEKKAVDELTTSIAKLDDAIKHAPKTGSTDLGLGHTPKEKAEKAPKSRMSGWEEKLDESKVAWAALQDQQDQAQAYSLADEAAYWSKILSRDDLSNEERLGAMKAYLAAHSQLTKQAIDQRMADYKKEIDAAKGNLALQQQIAGEELAYIGKKYGEQSTQYKAMQDTIVNLAHAAAEEQKRIADETAQHIAKLEQQQIAEVEKVDEFRVAMGLETQGELIKAQQAAEAASWASTSREFEKRKSLWAVESAEWKKLNADQESAKAAHEAKMTELERKAILQRTQLERQAISSTANLWGQNIAKMITLQQGFAATVHNIYVGMVGIVSDALAQIIEQWLVKHLSALLIGGAASKASGVAEITTAAAIAGANGVASFALAPWPIDLGAPAFGASMAAAAMGFSSMLAVPSLAGGSLRTAEGLTMIHENEAVIPAWGADGLRNMIAAFNTGYMMPSFSPQMPSFSLPAALSRPMFSSAGQAANANSPFAANDGNRNGDLHYHDHSSHGMTPDQIMANRSAIAKALKKAHREGAFTGTSINF